MTSSQQFPITPESFWAAFSTKLRLEWNENVESFYDDKKKWTDFLTDLLKKIGEEKFSCHVDLEYWPRVDLSYFDRCCEDWAEWSREVAIELENDDSWTDEVCKLMEINAGLKVLIAYTSDRKATENDLERLCTIQKSRKYVTNPCSWLLIFGPHSKDPHDDFIAYKFDGQKISVISGDTKIITSRRT